MLTTIRSKPHHEKQIIAGIITVILFSAIVFVWWSSRDARSNELVVQAKTVSPIEGVTSMFSGFVAGFTKEVSKASVDKNNEIAAPTAGSSFDLSGVVVIDPSITTATTTATSTTPLQGL